MTWLFASVGIGLHAGALVWSLWLLRVYAHRWLIFLPVAIFLSTAYAIVSLKGGSEPDWWLSVEFSLVFYGICLLIGGIGLHLGLVRNKERIDALDERVTVFHQFAESAPLGFFIYQDGAISYFNDAAARMTGYTRDELDSFSLSSLVDPEAQELMASRMRAREKGEALSNEYQVPIRTKSGERRWVQINVGTILYRGKPAGLGTALDVTERRLEQERLQFQSDLLNRIGEAVIAKNLDGWITYANDAARRMFGIERIASSPFEVAPYIPIEKQIQNFPGLLDTLRAGQVWAKEEVGYRNDGTTFPVALVVSPLTDEAGTLTGLVAVAADISERKSTEEALRTSEERLRLAARAGRLYVWDLDPRSRQVTYMRSDTRSPERLISEQIALERLLEWLNPEDRSALLPLMDGARLREDKIEREIRIRSTGNAFEWWNLLGQCHYDAAGELVRVVGTVRNITRRKRTEETLRARTIELENISDHVPYQIVRCNDEGHILFANRAALEVAGLSPHEYMQKHLESFIGAPEPAGVWRNHLRQVFASAAPVEFEYDQKIGDTTRDFQGLAVPEFDDNQQVQTAMLICHDVTESKKLQKEVLEISAREQRRIGQDLHDGLGQLLTGIGFKVALLQQEVRDRGSFDETTLEEISGLVEGAIGLTRQLAEGLDPVTVDMRGIQDGLERLALHTEKVYGIPCSLSVEDRLPALGDAVATHVYRIAQEAVNNAVKHAEPSAVQIRLDREHDRIVLRVTDNGSGIGPDARKNGGLGLRIMDYRARMIAGEFHIMASPAGGTIVTCRFALPTTDRNGRPP